MNSAATSLMIPDYNLESSMHFVRITWQFPKYKPQMYKLSASCKQTGVGKYQISITLDSSSTSAEVTGLHPRSVCSINIIAIYNPASIDPGITISATTEGDCNQSTLTHTDV